MKSMFSFSVIFMGILMFTTIVVVVCYPESNWQTNVMIAMQGPSIRHIFGLDSLGRDLFLRTIHGAQMTLMMGLICSLLSFFIGVIYGGISAWVGNLTDQLMMRAMEVIMALPQMVTIGLLVMLFSYRGGVTGVTGIFKLSLAISLGSWMTFARLTRNLVIKEKSLMYVEAATAIGSKPFRIFWRELGPNIAPSLMIMFGLQIPNFLLFESLLSFMGLGIQPPLSSWGLLIQEGWKSTMAYPHTLIFPALILFLTVFSLNVIFERFRQRVLRTFEPVDTHH